MRFVKVAGIIVIPIVLLISWFFYTQNKYAETAIPFIEELVHDYSTGQVEMLKKYEAKDSAHIMSDGDWDRLAKMMLAMGGLQEIKEISFVGVENNESTQGDSGKFIKYQVYAIYANGEALMNIRLKDLENDSFSLDAINFQTDVQLPQ